MASIVLTLVLSVLLISSSVLSNPAAVAAKKSSSTYKSPPLLAMETLELIDPTEKPSNTLEKIADGCAEEILYPEVYEPVPIRERPCFAKPPIDLVLRFIHRRKFAAVLKALGNLDVSTFHHFVDQLDWSKDRYQGAPYQKYNNLIEELYEGIEPRSPSTAQLVDLVLQYLQEQYDRDYQEEDEMTSREDAAIEETSSTEMAMSSTAWMDM